MEATPLTLRDSGGLGGEREGGTSIPLAEFSLRQINGSLTIHTPYHSERTKSLGVLPRSLRENLLSFLFQIPQLGLWPRAEINRFSRDK